MTEKQYKLEQWSSLSLYYSFPDGNLHHSIGKVIARVENDLNSLYNENEQLKDALNQRTDQCDNYYKENEQLKQQINKLEAQLYCPFDSICIKCNNEYLVQKEYYYVSKCKKGHEQCSKEDVKYCEDFEVKELQE